MPFPNGFSLEVHSFFHASSVHICIFIYFWGGFSRQDILGQFSMVNLELYNIVEDIKKVSKAFVVHPKNVNAENAASNYSNSLSFFLLIIVFSSSLPRSSAYLLCCIFFKAQSLLHEFIRLFFIPPVMLYSKFCSSLLHFSANVVNQDTATINLKKIITKIKLSVIFNCFASRAVLPVMLSSKLLPEMEMDDNSKREQLLLGMQNLPVSAQIEKLKVTHSLTVMRCKSVFSPAFTFHCICVLID